MAFKDELNEYIVVVEISAKDLAEASGLAPSTISRFRSGKRTPAPDSEALLALVDSIYAYAQKKGNRLVQKEEIYERLSQHLGDAEEDKQKFRENLNHLISALSISVASLAREINYDASQISRIRTGKRQASDIKKLGGEIATYVSLRYSDLNSKVMVADLISCTIETLATPQDYRGELLRWLISNENFSDVESSMRFLKSLNDFNLDEYIKAIHFDTYKAPSVSFPSPMMSKTYTGLDGFKQAELDWLKATVLSKSMEPVIMYSDMPIEEMAKDLQFGKKWMFGMALMLKKGLQIHQIHNLDRSFTDMMLGLESWIPLYMTGQISPYYFKRVNNTVFMNFFRVSGSAACSGEAISGSYADGRYVFVKGSNDVRYYKKRGEALLSKATPLMNTYTRAKAASLGIFMDKASKVEGARRSMLSALPLYTLSDNLLERILHRNHIAQENAASIRAHHALLQKRIKAILSHSPIWDEIPVLSKETFEARPMALSISGIFFSKDILYAYEEYVEHLEQTRRFAEANERYSIIENSNPPFSHIQIYILEKKWVMVSKDKAPTIHFVIRHPRLRDAIENMIVPYTE